MVKDDSQGIETRFQQNAGGERRVSARSSGSMGKGNIWGSIKINWGDKRDRGVSETDSGPNPDVWVPTRGRVTCPVKKVGEQS